VSQVVLLSHHGVGCAIPAAQVVRSTRGGGEAEIDLWGGPDRVTQGEVDRAMVVSTAAGLRKIACEHARVAWLDTGAMHPIPDVLRDKLGLPHVVGVAETQGGLLWLVDLAEWEEP
jgi:hypothetical protein